MNYTVRRAKSEMGARSQAMASGRPAHGLRNLAPKRPIEYAPTLLAYPLALSHNHFIRRAHSRTANRVPGVDRQHSLTGGEAPHCTRRLDKIH